MELTFAFAHCKISIQEKHGGIRQEAAMQPTKQHRPEGLSHFRGAKPEAPPEPLQRRTAGDNPGPRYLVQQAPSHQKPGNSRTWVRTRQGLRSFASLEGPGSWTTGGQTTGQGALRARLPGVLTLTPCPLHLRHCSLSKRCRRIRKVSSPPTQRCGLRR